jgi:hypothetical protein
MKQAILINSSPRKAGSSGSVLAALELLLGRQGVASQRFHASEVLEAPGGAAHLARTMGDAGAIVLVFPLYVDTLPAVGIELLEALVNAGIPPGAGPAPWFLAVGQCGFPEASQNATALETCRHFATTAGLRWHGGLALGMGPVIQGRPLTPARRPLVHVWRALDQAVADLLADRALSAEAVATMARPALPIWLYRIWVNALFRMEAWRRGAYGRRWDAPYGPAARA